MIRGNRPKAVASKLNLLQTLFGTSIVLVGVRMMCWTPVACAATPEALVAAQHEERSLNRTVRCLPVAHDILWKRLRLVVADFEHFRTDSSDRSSLEVGNLTAPSNNDTLEPQTIAGGSLDQRKTVSSDIQRTDDTRTPSFQPGTLPSAESNIIPDVTTHSSDGLHPNLHPRLDRLLGDRKVRRHRRNKRLRRRKLMSAIFRKTSWHCHMSKYWKKMSPGIFPPYVQTARCRQRSCMLGMFECRPRRYRIKLLRRNDGVCNPLPNIATQTDYEETWTFVEYKVVVGCECSKKYGAGSYTRHDRPTANTSRQLKDVSNS